MDRDSLNIEGNVVWNIGNWAGNFTSVLVGGVGDDSIAAKNVYANPGLISVGQTHGSLDPRPAVGGPAVTTTHYQMGDPFFDNVTYAGAFSPTDNWTQGWTAISQMGIGDSHLRVQPFAGKESAPIKLLQSAAWDFVITQTIPGTLDIAASTAFLDGAPVTSTFQGGIWPAVTVLTNGDRAYRANGQSGFVFGTLGKHNLRLRMVLTSGVVLEDTFYWEIVN